MIQFSDAETATTAKAALDGRCIPSYLLPELEGACTLRITYSAHSVLNVKFQSHRSRDFTNPYLPVAPSAIDGSGLDGKKQEAESNVLLASVENMQYVVTIDGLHEVFSAFGFVQKIAIFEKNSGFQALIQYPDVQTAVTAKEALEGHSIYEGGYCKLHLTFSRHTDLNVKINNERGRDYTRGNIAPACNQPSILGPQPAPHAGASATPYSSVPSAASGAVVPPGTTPILATPGAPSASLPYHPSSEAHSQTGILQGPPSFHPQFPGYGAPQFPPGSTQAQMVQHSGQGSQQMPNHVEHQLPPGSPQFMQYPGNGSHPGPNTPGPQASSFPGHGGQQLPPDPRMMQPPGYRSQPFTQGSMQPMPQFPTYNNQQFPFPGQGGQCLPFARSIHPYNH